VGKNKIVALAKNSETGKRKRTRRICVVPRPGAPVATVTDVWSKASLIASLSSSEKIQLTAAD
jgi:hypothetical protein